MKLSRLTICLAAILAASDSTGLATQRLDLPGFRPAKKQDQLTTVEFVSPEELKAKIARNEPLVIVDLRAQSLYEQSDRTIKGSLHTKVRKVAHRLREHSRDEEIVTYCSCPADEAAIIAARSLRNSGFKRVRVLRGGWNAWVKASGQVEPRHRV